MTSIKNNWTYSINIAKHESVFMRLITVNHNKNEDEYEK